MAPAGLGPGHLDLDEPPRRQYAQPVGHDRRLGRRQVDERPSSPPELSIEWTRRSHPATWAAPSLTSAWAPRPVAWLSAPIRTGSRSAPGLWSVGRRELPTLTFAYSVRTKVDSATGKKGFTGAITWTNKNTTMLKGTITWYGRVAAPRAASTVGRARRRAGSAPSNRITTQPTIGSTGPRRNGSTRAK